MMRWLSVMAIAVAVGCGEESSGDYAPALMRAADPCGEEKPPSGTPCEAGWGECAYGGEICCCDRCGYDFVCSCEEGKVKCQSDHWGCACGDDGLPEE